VSGSFSTPYIGDKLIPPLMAGTLIKDIKNPTIGFLTLPCMEMVGV